MMPAPSKARYTPASSRRKVLLVVNPPRLLESAPDAMVLVDEKGQIALLNSRAEEMFGYRREELFGQPVERLVPMGFGQDTRAHQYGLRKDGSGFPIQSAGARWPPKTEY